MKKILLALVASTMISSAASATTAGQSSFNINNSDGTSTQVTISSGDPDVYLTANVQQTDENGYAGPSQLKFYVALDYMATYITAASVTASNEALENIAQTLEITLGTDVTTNIGLINTKINQMAADKTMWENTAISSQAYYSALLDQFNALTESVNADYLAITEMETGAPRDHMLRMAFLNPTTPEANDPISHDAQYNNTVESLDKYSYMGASVTDNVRVVIRRNGNVKVDVTVDTFHAGGGNIVKDSVFSAIETAHTAGFDEGWTEGWAYGWADGYTEGWDDGYEEGYDDGYADGWDDAIASVTNILDN